MILGDGSCDKQEVVLSVFPPRMGCVVANYCTFVLGFALSPDMSYYCKCVLAPQLLEKGLYICDFVQTKDKHDTVTLGS